MKQKTAKNSQTKRSLSEKFKSRKLWIILGSALLLANTITILVLLAHASLLSIYTFNSSFWPSRELDDHMNSPSTLLVKLSMKSATDAMYGPLFYANDKNQLVIPEARLALPVEFASKDLLYSYVPAYNDEQSSNSEYIIINTQNNINGVLTMTKLSQVPCIQRVATITFDPNTDDSYTGSTKTTETLSLADGRTAYINTIEHEGCNYSNPELGLQTRDLLKKLTSY